MIKKCLRKITLKEAVNKVAALVDKNMTAPKSFIEVVGNFTDEEVNPDVSPFDEHLSTIITVTTRLKIELHQRVGDAQKGEH